MKWNDIELEEGMVVKLNSDLTYPANVRQKLEQCDYEVTIKDFCTEYGAFNTEEVDVINGHGINWLFDVDYYITEILGGTIRFDLND